MLKAQLKTVRDEKLNERKLHVCTVGRISNQKNPELFEDIANEFKNISFTWIGNGEKRDVLKANNIYVTGWKKREDVLKELKKNQVFILTSLWEGLPYSLLEAMYMEKICIVSNCVGNRDVIINNVNGFVAKNKEDYISIIRKINNNDINRNLIVKNAKQAVELKYNVNVMAEKYIKLYAK